ncbi:E3 ubiquitin-protein ligase TRAIP-like [Paramacrobiotus metropolitanus]|uniref:E3 ubiquitin-protein ligase TRAIP-like n=1 Tax=Paramacrobiotus metropolitanus TaxID=2943436 RepID=UPI0024456BC0|nr:E3 ubiquitin-protein ligase TRAIP-like [Paramacrobiotus metropolitanus]
MAVQCSICLGSSSSLNVETSPFSSIPCGHVYHFACISQWLQSAGKCPECRTPCSSQKVVRLFLKHESQSADISISDAAAEYAQQWIEKCQTKARECEQALHEVNEQKLLLEKSNEHIKNLERTCSARQSEIQQYKERMTVLSGTRMKLEKSREENEKLRKECKTWRDEAEKLQRVSCVMTGSVTDVKGMLANIQSNADFTAVRDSLMCCIEALKMEMEKMKSNDKEMRDETAKSRSHQVKLDEQFKSMVNKNKHLLEELRERDERIKRLELKICTLEKLLKRATGCPSNPGQKIHSRESNAGRHRIL